MGGVVFQKLSLFHSLLNLGRQNFLLIGFPCRMEGKLEVIRSKGELNMLQGWWQK